MTVWTGVAGVLLLCLGLSLVAACRGDTLARITGVLMSTALGVLLVLVLAALETLPMLIDVALLVALLSFPGGLVYARFLEEPG